MEGEHICAALEIILEGGVACGACASHPFGKLHCTATQTHLTTMLMYIPLPLEAPYVGKDEQRIRYHPRRAN